LAVRLKPVTARVVGWAAHFLEADWSLDDVAWLFDICPEALLTALEAG
jgi:hypothetical protein